MGFCLRVQCWNACRCVRSLERLSSPTLGVLPLCLVGLRVDAERDARIHVVSIKMLSCIVTTWGGRRIPTMHPMLVIRHCCAVSTATNCNYGFM